MMPTPPPDQAQPADPFAGTLLDRIWQRATQYMHGDGAGRTDTPAQLDDYVRQYTGGKVADFQTLAKIRQTQQSRVGQQRVAQAGTPSALVTGAESAANAAGLGLPRKLERAGWGIGGNQGIDELLNRGEAAHPLAATIGEAAGSLAPSTAAGVGAAGPAATLAMRVPVNALMRLGIQGAVTGAAAGATGAYSASPDLAPHPSEIGRGALWGAATGAPLGAVGGWAATKLNPAEHLAGRAIQEASPGETPAFGAGVRALQSGGTTPMRVGPPAAGVEFTPQAEAAYQKLPPELRPMNFEKAPSLRALASKGITQSAEASAHAEKLINERIQNIVTARRTVENDPATGYNAILRRPLRDEELNQLPAQTQAALRGSSYTMRAVYDRMKDVRDEASSIFKMRDQGTGRPDLGAARQLSSEGDALRQWLGDHVPGFNDLQERTAPWLQREEELRLGKRQLIGRAIKPLGKTAPKPTGGIKEGMKEAVGYESSQIGERAARQFVEPLLSTDLNDLLHFVKQKPELIQKVPALLRMQPTLAGGAAGAAVTTRKRLQSLQTLMAGQNAP